MAFGKGGNRVFGQAMSKKGPSKYQRQFGASSAKDVATDSEAATREEAAARRRLRQEQGEAIDLQFGYERLEDKPVDPNLSPVERRGWLFHMLPTTVRCIGTRSGGFHTENLTFFPLKISENRSKQRCRTVRARFVLCRR